MKVAAWAVQLNVKLDQTTQSIGDGRLRATVSYFPHAGIAYEHHTVIGIGWKLVFVIMKEARQTNTT